MNNILEFRVICQKLEKAATSVSNILRENGFIISDLRESEMVKDLDGTMVSEVYVLCCQGKNEEYTNFKKKNKYSEMIYEGVKTLI
jgi:hypothetical protein